MMGKRRKRGASWRPAMNTDGADESPAAKRIYASTKASSENRTREPLEQPTLEQLCILHQFIKSKNMIKTARKFAEETHLMSRICTALFRAGCVKTLRSLRKGEWT